MCSPEEEQGDDRADGGQQQPIVEVDFNDTTSREYPAQVEIKHVQAVQEHLVQTRIRDICHGGELRGTTEAGSGRTKNVFGRGGTLVVLCIEATKRVGTMFSSADNL